MELEIVSSPGLTHINVLFDKKLGTQPGKGAIYNYGREILTYDERNVDFFTFRNTVHSTDTDRDFLLIVWNLANFQARHCNIKPL